MKFLFQSCWSLPIRLTILGMVTLAIRLAVWEFSPYLSRDGVTYLLMIRSWFEQGSYAGISELVQELNMEWIPAFPLWIMKLPMTWGMSAETSAGLSCILLGSMIPVIGFGIARTILPDIRMAWGTAILLAVHPTLIDLAVQPQRDILYLFWCGLCLLFLCRGIRRSAWYDWSGAGIFCAFSLLTRYETLELIPMVFFYFAGAVYLKQYRWKKAVFHLLLFLASLAVGGWLICSITGTRQVLWDQYHTYYIEKWNNFQRTYGVEEND